jgi:hypothetical protein
MSKLSTGMYRGYVTEDSDVFVGILNRAGDMKSLGKVDAAEGAAKPTPQR